MGHVFISYSHKDSVYVHKLQEALQKEGFDAWIDDRIDYGDEWLKVIQKHLDECDAFIIVMSTNSFESDMVQNEVTRVREKRKPVFPLLLDGDNWLIVQAKQFVDVRDGSLPTEKFYRRLESVTPRKNERAEREAAERTAQEKAKHEVAEKAERERVEKAAQDQLEREATEKVRKEKIERESAERIARQRTKHEAAERYKRERAEHRAAQINTLRQTILKTWASLKSIIAKEFPRLRVVGFAGIAIALFWLGWKNLPTSPLLITVSPSATSRIVLPTKTLTLTSAPTPTKTHLFTQTPSFTPTVTIPPTTIPPSSILFQRNFEDGDIGVWSWKDGAWVVKQEQDGNHYLSGSDPAAYPPQIYYGNKNLDWTDYAIENRVKFIEGSTLSICIRSDLGKVFYSIFTKNSSINFFQSWDSIGAGISKTFTPNRWYTIRMEIKGNLLSIYIENNLVRELKLQSPLIKQGGIGYIIDHGEIVYFDDIKVWSLK